MWEGIVTAVGTEEFSVMLYDLVSNRVQFGEIPFRALPAEQIAVIQPGVVFTWSSDDKRFNLSQDGKLAEEELQKRLEEAINHPSGLA